MMYKNIAVVILAAGASRRLGRPKQLEIYRGKSLIQHSIDLAKEINKDGVVVVLGAKYDKIFSEIMNNDISIIENKDWEQGMATSLRQGLDFAQNKISGINKIIFMVCDQPYVCNALLESLIQKNEETSLPIIASEYQDIKGTPALFDREVWPLLQNIEGDLGAGKIIKNNPDLVATVAFDKGEIDIDEEKDLKNLEC